jgi:hypothetical protein
MPTGPLSYSIKNFNAMKTELLIIVKSDIIMTSGISMMTENSTALNVSDFCAVKNKHDNQADSMSIDLYGVILTGEKGDSEWSHVTQKADQ